MDKNYIGGIALVFCLLFLIAIVVSLLIVGVDALIYKIRYR